jgi:polyketide cyclase/dehydrase/lipid transport protein
MRPMMRLVVGLGALVGIMAAVALGLPAHVTVTRSVVTNAPESAVFPYLANLHHFHDWSPWATRDPQLQLTYSGPESGKGARIDWVSQVRSIGTGSMEITNADPNKTIELAVNFNGVEGTSLFDIAPSGSGSKVTWSFGYESGSSPLKRWKALALDGLVGAEYRAGLDKLKAKIDEDRRPTAPAAGLVPPAPGGASTQTEQPSAALPPGAAVPPGAPTATGTAPATTGAATPATGAPAGSAAQASGTQTQASQPTAEAVTPTPPPAQPPKKKRRRQQ